MEQLMKVAGWLVPKAEHKGLDLAPKVAPSKVDYKPGSDHQRSSDDFMRELEKTVEETQEAQERVLSKIRAFDAKTGGTQKR